MAGKLLLEQWLHFMLTTINGEKYIFNHNHASGMIEMENHPEGLVVETIHRHSGAYILWIFPWDVLQEFHELNRVAGFNNEALMRTLIRHSAAKTAEFSSLLDLYVNRMTESNKNKTMS